MALLGLILLTAATAAVPSQAAPDLYTCMTKATGEQDYQRCNARHLADLEKQLEAALHKLQDSVSLEGEPKALAALNTEQRAWRSYQRKACQLFWRGSYGTDQRWLDGPACQADVIEARIKALETSYAALDPDQMGH